MPRMPLLATVVHSVNMKEARKGMVETLFSFRIVVVYESTCIALLRTSLKPSTLLWMT
jgi:hypothetical protein